MSDSFVDAVVANIQMTHQLFATGEPPGFVGTVSGSSSAQRFWQQQLDGAKVALGARAVHSFYEDLPVNQAFGLFLLWQRLKPQYEVGEGALIAFVFGEGSRATPLTEAECGQKPAIRSFVRRPGGKSGEFASIVEVALRYFAPVEGYLRRSGFDGVVVKWGDEVQIPTRDLSGTDELFRDADVVRFVSMQRMEHDSARNKDWVGVAESGEVTAFIPRRPLAEMAELAERGLVLERDGALYGGVNLGSIAISGALLDLCLEEFRADVNDRSADRRERPDLDPQLFTALTVAIIEDDDAREHAWKAARGDSPAVAAMAERDPGLFGRLVGVARRFLERHGRQPRVVAMDFGDQYWGDIGQHSQMREFVMALRSDGSSGKIARALAGIEGGPDKNGNWLIGACEVGPETEVSGSVLIDAKIKAGLVRDSVLIGTEAGRVDIRDAFDLGSVCVELELDARAGSYRVASREPVRAGEGERLTTVMLPEGPCLMRVHEATDLRDRAHTYDEVVLGNTLSFADAHRRVLSADLDVVALDRARLEDEVRALLRS